MLEAYLLLGRRPGAAAPLERRVELLVSQLAAELSGCAWCMEAGRHRCRKAGIAPGDLALLRADPGSPCFSERERAALGFGRAVAGAVAGGGQVPASVAAALRRHFSEREIVRLTVLAAGEHFGDGAAASGPDASLSDPISIRGWT